MSLINVQHKTTINNLVEGFKSRLNNPYYLFTDKKATLVTYYNQSTTKSTLDDSTKQFFAPLGKDSPLKFNKIEDAYLYGIEKITLNIETTDWGTESSAIEGEAIILPNTFKPIPQDYFCIDYASKKLLFKVLEVNIDTLENGANFYKIAYKLDQTNYTEADLKSQVSEEFTMIVTNVGTQFSSVIKSNDYKFLNEINNITNQLKSHYNTLFFNDRIQTFTYEHDCRFFYDPYMIEFIKRNKILKSDKYISVEHAQKLEKDFNIIYNKTFFRSLELGDIDNIRNPEGYGFIIKDINSLLYTRVEDYYTISYNKSNIFLEYPIEAYSEELIKYIKDKNEIELFDYKCIYEIIMKYFNRVRINGNMIYNLNKIDYNRTKELFYLIPVVIFVLESDAIKLMIGDFDTMNNGHSYYTDYIHPTNHPADMIIESDRRQFVTKEEKSKIEQLLNITVPTKLSELNNDSNFITIDNVPTKLSSFTNDSNFITASDINIPTKTSELTNDSGYITIGDVNVSVPTKLSSFTNDTNFITLADVNVSVPTKLSSFTNDTNFITLIDVPTKLSSFTNDSNFITASDINIPTKTSELTNDSNFITVSDIDTHNTSTDSHQDIRELITNEAEARSTAIAGIETELSTKQVSGDYATTVEVLNSLTTAKNYTDTQFKETSAIGQGVWYYANDSTLSSTKPLTLTQIPFSMSGTNVATKLFTGTFEKTGFFSPTASYIKSVTFTGLRADATYNIAFEYKIKGMTIWTYAIPFTARNTTEEITITIPSSSTYENRIYWLAGDKYTESVAINKTQSGNNHTINMIQSQSNGILSFMQRNGGIIYANDVFIEQEAKTLESFTSEINSKIGSISTILENILGVS